MTRRMRLIAGILSWLVLVAALPGAALASPATETFNGYKDWQIFDAYAGGAATTAWIRTPNTYGAGCDAGSDTITVYNTGSAPVRIRGEVRLEQINNGTIEVLQTYLIDFTVPANTPSPGLTLLTIAYPYLGGLPVADPQTGIKELHVNVALGNFGDGQGDGADWDVYSFCNEAQGCTPGYWKNHTEAWPIATSTTLSSVFSGAVSTKYANYSLLSALRLKGGSDLSGAQQILFRAAAAAYLNAVDTGVNYAYSVTEVTTMVNSALASNNRATIIDTAARLDAANNAGCPKN